MSASLTSRISVRWLTVWGGHSAPRPVRPAWRTQMSACKHTGCSQLLQEVAQFSYSCGDELFFYIYIYAAHFSGIVLFPLTQKQIDESDKKAKKCCRRTLWSDLNVILLYCISWLVIYGGSRPALSRCCTRCSNHIPAFSSSDLLPTTSFHQRQYTPCAYVQSHCKFLQLRLTPFV